MAIATQFNSSNGPVNLNGSEYKISSWDLKCISNIVSPSLHYETGFSKFEPLVSVSNKYKTETNIEYVDSYSTKIPISPMLTEEEDRERIIEEAKIRCAVSWLEV